MAIRPSKKQPSLDENARLWRRMLYNKIENIFLVKGLPEEIPVRVFNLFLFRYGKVVFYKIGSQYMVQPFTYTNVFNPYYIPLKGRVVNPYLPPKYQSWEFTLDEQCVIYNSTTDMYNERPFSQVADLIWKTANQLAEIDISYYAVTRNSRLIALFTAETDLQRAEMDRVLSRMYNGCVDITMGEDIVSHIRVNPISQESSRNKLTELVEFTQYILANFYHDFGINSNYNLKREQLNSDEIDVNQEVLRMNIEDMLVSRQDAVKKINEKYGLGISIDLNEKLYSTLLESQNETESENNNDTENEVLSSGNNELPGSRGNNQKSEEENVIRNSDGQEVNSGSERHSERDEEERGFTKDVEMDTVSPDTRHTGDRDSSIKDRDASVPHNGNDTSSLQQEVSGSGENESAVESSDDTASDGGTFTGQSAEEDSMDDRRIGVYVENYPEDTVVTVSVEGQSEVRKENEDDNNRTSEVNGKQEDTV